MIGFQRKKEELTVNDKEWHSVWMLKKVQKRKGMEHFQYQELRDVLKVEGDRMKEFVAKYLEVKFQTSREKIVNTQYSSLKVKKVYIIQCLWALIAYQGEEVKKQEIEES